MKYNPAVSPDPKQWLALDEQARIQIVEDYHRRASIALPQPALHAVIHAIVEQQLAMGLPPVLAALGRLMGQGLDRHDALHAIGSVMAAHMRQVMNSDPVATDPNAPYFAALEQLSAESWRRDFGSDERAV